MPRSFETVITVLENIPGEELTLEITKCKLRAEIEKRRAVSANQNSASSTDQHRAVFLTNQQGACYICGQKGHFKRNCPRNTHIHSGTVRDGEQHRYYRGRGYKGHTQRNRGNTNWRRPFAGGRSRNFSRNFRGRVVEEIYPKQMLVEEVTMLKEKIIKIRKNQ